MKKSSDGFVRVDRIDLKSLDEQLERHLNRNTTTAGSSSQVIKKQGRQFGVNNLKTVIAVTPTYARTFQALQLTGVMHSLMLTDPAPFQTLISHLMSSANDQRSQAELLFNLSKLAVLSPIPGAQILQAVSAVGLEPHTGLRWLINTVFTGKLVLFQTT
ncbi:hypothetical protein EV1_027882 [Malus domestica]